MGSYQSFRELAANEIEGVDFRVRTRQGTSEVAVMAIHGGGIEPGTTEIAEAIAEGRHYFYSFSGLKPSGNWGLHITSRRFDEPQGLEIARNASTILVIHGCKESGLMVYIGGKNILLKSNIRNSLESAGFQVGKSAKFTGMSPLNICNRGRLKAGVQLEICHGLRQRMFQSLKRHQRDKTTQTFHRFVNALKEALDHYKC